jgi:hypothetical protein
MFSKRFRVVLSVCILAALSPVTPARAQSTVRYRYTFVDIPAPAGSHLPDLSLRGLTSTGTFAGVFLAADGYSARVTDGEVTPIFCPPDEFPRYPFPALLGPEVLAMNNEGTVIGNDQGVDGGYAFLQTADGTCVHFRGAVGGSTYALGISDLGVIVGFYGDPTSGAGLLMTHGFLRDATGFHRLDGPGPQDVVFPTAINSLGDIVGYIYQDVQPDNTYTYQAFIFRDGVYEFVDSPTGEDLWLVDINNRGEILGLLGVATIAGSRPFLLDHGVSSEIQLPTSGTLSFLPTALTDHGQIVGQDVEPNPGGSPPVISHQVLGTPCKFTPDPAHRPHGHPRHKPHPRRHLGHWEHAQRGSHPKIVVPALDDAGVPVWTRGQQILGRRGR